MKLNEVLKDIEKIIKCKVVIMEGKEERYNDYLNKNQVYAYLQDEEIVEINSSDNQIIITVGEKEETFEILEGMIITELMRYETVYLKSPKEFNIKAAEYWGMLLLASQLKVITWDRAMYLFGEFTSKAMNLR